MHIIFTLIWLKCLFISNYIYFLFTSRSSPYLIQQLKYKLLNSGPILLKLGQWTISKIELQYPTLKNKLDTFKDLYENCNIHPISHTLSVYKQEYNTNLYDDYEIQTEYSIKSGSIAQVYIAKCKKTKHLVAIKCIHPYNNNIFNYSVIFFRIATWIFELLFSYNFFCCKINDLIFWIKKQINLENEFKNIQIFYNIYKDNKYIIIPKPISCSKNILIMSYESGENIDDIDISMYNKNKLLLLLVAFIKNNLYIHRIAHCDLHLGNWKIKKITNSKLNNYALTIYDFGLCSTNISSTVTNYLDDWVLKDYEKLTEFNINSIILNKYLTNNKQIIYDDLKEIAIDSNGNFDIYISKILKYHSNNSLQVPIEKINIFISLILLQNTLKKYGILAATKHSSDFYFNDTNSLISLCETLDILPELKDYLENLFEHLKKKDFYVKTATTFNKKIDIEDSKTFSTLSI